jgi:2-polyprenyl-3-methyl-5-hydroxy-6-metoxy-1,4-benzoquinol methylase
MTDEYVLGRTSAETERLQIQARLLAPNSVHLFRLAGITPGMRVLDVGCGAGDVSMLLAELVGPQGTVTGVDVNPAIVDLARARTAEAGLANVSFVHADLADLRVEAPVDAVAGRLVLFHLKQPAAAVRALSRLVRPGGLMTFQDFNSTRARTVPPTPLATKCTEWIISAFRAVGLTPDLGDQIAPLLRDAGLIVEGAASATIAGPAESAMPRYLADTLRSVMPAVLAHCQVTEAEVDIETLTGRLTQEFKEAGATFWMPELAAAWARVPQAMAVESC